jgi:putative inorganic carbon (HCO3(-)) transporter
MLEIFLILIFIRPFISSLAFPFANFFISLSFFIFLAVWFIRRGAHGGKNPLLRYAILLFLVALFISLIFSQNPTTSWAELYKYVTGLLILILGFSLTRRERNKIILAMTVSGLLVSVLAIYQYFFGFKALSVYVSKNQITNPFILDYISRKRVFFPFVTPNILGGYLAMMIPLALIQRNEAPQAKANGFLERNTERPLSMRSLKGVGFWPRTYKIVFMAPLLLALLLTQSISAFLALFLGMLFYFYLQGRLEKKKIFILSGLLVMAGLVLISRITNQKLHLQPGFSAAMRLNYWRDTIQIIKAFLVAGVGLGNFNLAYSRYAHNSYLQIWAETGLLGIISILWLIVCVYKSTLMNIGKTIQRNQAAGLMAAGAVFLIHNLADFTFFLPEVAIPWWMILGLLLSKDSDELNSRNTNL